MRDPVEVITKVVCHGHGGIAVVYCPDIDLLKWLVGEVESLAPEGSNPVRKHDVDGALAEASRLVMLIPDNERDVVLDLDASCDRLLEPSNQGKRIILFLIRGAAGERSLAAEAMSLASWIAGSTADPEMVAEVDVGAERDDFERESGKTPEAWLESWKGGGRPLDLRNFRTSYRAMLLEFQ